MPDGDDQGTYYVSPNSFIKQTVPGEDGPFIIRLHHTGSG